jgi:hypothetical protein
MRSHDELAASAREGSPFSNGTMGEIWMDRWCYRCKVDAPYQRDESDEGCPLLLVALVGKTPAEWVELGDAPQDYTCTEFIPDDEDGGAGGGPRVPPPPAADIDGQTDIFAAFADQIAERATDPAVAHA